MVVIPLRIKLSWLKMRIIMSKLNLSLSLPLSRSLVLSLPRFLSIHRELFSMILKNYYVEKADLIHYCIARVERRPIRLKEITLERTISIRERGNAWSLHFWSFCNSNWKKNLIKYLSKELLLLLLLLLLKYAEFEKR